MAALTTDTNSLVISFLGLADEYTIVAEVGFLACGVPLLNDEVCTRLYSRRLGFFEIWQEDGDKLIPFLEQRIAHKDAGSWQSDPDEDFHLTVVPGYGFPFLLEERPYAGNKLNATGSDAILQRIGGVLSDKTPHFTLLMKPGDALRMGSSGKADGPIFQMHVSADDLADFYFALKHEYALVREHEIFEVNSTPPKKRPQK